jgi:hypothetical protein
MLDFTRKKHLRDFSQEEVDERLRKSDERITLREEDHVYLIREEDGSTTEVTVSSSKVLSLMFTPFDPIFSASNVSRNARSGRYAGKTFPQVLKMWEDAARFGSQFHAMIEDYYIAGEKVDRTEWKDRYANIGYASLIDAFFAYADKMSTMGWKPYRSEKIVFDIEEPVREFRYPPGSADMVYQRMRKGKLERLMVDFKTSESKKKFTEVKSPTEASWPLKAIPNSKVSMGFVQAAIYSALRESLYGEPLEEQRIVAFYWDDPELQWEMHDPPRSYVPDGLRVIKMYKERQKVAMVFLKAYGRGERVNHPLLPSTKKPI